jgi:hypothetical protein
MDKEEDRIWQIKSNLLSKKKICGDFSGWILVVFGVPVDTEVAKTIGAHSTKHPHFQTDAAAPMKFSTNLSLSLNLAMSATTMGSFDIESGLPL